jgi:UDP-glucose 4-epimerase
VTGAAGFIGSHFVDYLIEQDHQVLGIDDLSFGKMENVNEKSEFIKADVRDYSTIEKIICTAKPSHIVHFAANATSKSSAMGWNDPMADYTINMVGTLNILEILRRHAPNIHFLYASSAAVYGEPVRVPIVEDHPNFPVSPYGISKLAGEKYCFAYSHEYGIPITIFRIFNTYGPRQPRYVMFDQIKKMLPEPERFEVLGTGEQLRDYVYVSDTVRAFYICMTNPKAVGEIFNLGSGQPITIQKLILLIKSLLGVKSQEIFTGESWKGDIRKLWADAKRINEIIGWKPRMHLEEGIERLITWMKVNEKV